MMWLSFGLSHPDPPTRCRPGDVSVEEVSLDWNLELAEKIPPVFLFE